MSTLLTPSSSTVGVEVTDKSVHSHAKDKIKKVLIVRPNHRLGNLLLITPLVQEVIKTFPHAKIDLFVKGNLGPLIFKNYQNINHLIQLPRKPFKNIFKYIMGWLAIRKTKYDIVINAINHSSSGRLSAQFANAKHHFSGDINGAIELKHDDHEHMSKYPVYSFRTNLSRFGFSYSKNPIPPINLILEASEIERGKKLLTQLVKNDRRTICLYTYATGKKLYSKVWWEEFFARISNELKEFNIIEVLPIENVSQITFKAPTFYSKDIREIGAFLKGIDVFITADGGVMHLASAVQVPAIGLFKVTNPKIYKPLSYKSVAIDTNATDIDGCVEILKRLLTDIKQK